MNPERYSNMKELALKSTISYFFWCFGVAVDKQYDISRIDADHIYQAAYDFGRYMNLYREQDFGALLSDEQKNMFKKSFPDVFENLVFFLSAHTNNYEPWRVVEVKVILSELAFIRDELFELYTTICGGDRAQLETEKMKKSIQTLQDKLETIEEEVEVWLNPDFLELVSEDPKDLPDLSGVPDSHTWWSSEQREQSKQRHHP